MTKFNIKNVRITKENKNIMNLITKKDTDERLKVAIYFSGRIQNNKYKMNKEHLKNYDKMYNVKYFISLNKNANTDKFVDMFCKDFDINEEQVNIEEIEVPNEIRESNLRVTGNLGNMYSMFYNNYMCMELINKYEKKNKHKFDIVIKYRADIYGKKNIEIGDVDENTIYIPFGYDYGGLNDQIAYGNVESMTKYGECYLNFLGYGILNNDFHPEGLLSRHIKTKLLNIKRFEYEYRLNKL